LLPQRSPVMQWGEHMGAVHFPFVQTPDPQSSAPPHAVPTPQVGAQ
jgi:hypothetical protein